MGIIYSATNKITGHQYIGKTSYSLEERIKSHQKRIRQGSKTKFYDAIRSYGFNTFEFNEIDSAKLPNVLNEKEIFWIAKLDTFNSGYNMTLGGDGGIPDTVTRNKIAASRIGKKASQETKLKMSKSRGIRSNYKYSYEISFPDAHKEIIINLAQFCRDHNLHQGSMVHVIHGQRKQHKGFSGIKIG
jgi:group I intron endonuclease